MRPSCAAIAIVLCTSAVRAEGGPPAAAVDSIGGVRVVRKPRLALAISGAAIFGSGYVLSFLVALAGGFGGISPVVLVPLAGPWIGFGYDMANPYRCPLGVESPDCTAFAVDLPLAFAGGLQLVGATLFGVGMVRHDVKRPVRVAPTFSFASGPRLGVRVTF